MYDASIARWNGTDALAEMYSNSSPYNYVLNSPINLFDPDGRRSASAIEDWDKDPQSGLVERRTDSDRGFDWRTNWQFGESIDTKYVNNKTGEEVEVKDGIDKTIKVSDTDFARAKEFASIEQLQGIDMFSDDWTQETQLDYYNFYNSVNSYDELSLANLWDYFMGGPDDGIIAIDPGLPGGKATGVVLKGASKPTISAIKEALEKVYKQLDIDKALPKMKKGTGPKSTPRAGNGKKGYRLDPPHDHKPFWHIDWWTGKRKAGKTGFEKIE